MHLWWSIQHTCKSQDLKLSLSQVLLDHRSVASLHTSINEKRSEVFMNELLRDH